MADRTFLKEVDDACEAALQSLGFSRPRRGTIYLDINEEFLGWVGLNVGNHGDLVRINPNIGIHCRPVEELRKSLVANEKQRYRKGDVSTYGVPLGTQTPEDTDAIQFAVGHPLNREARRLSMLIGEYGVPWMLRHASYDALVPLLEQRFAYLPNYPDKLVAMYYFSGAVDRSVQFIEEVQTILRKEEDPTLLRQFERFSVPFLKALESGELPSLPRSGN